jgi:dinuclear metal center YbgI/SA1388 family protein
MYINEIYNYLDSLSPFSLQEKWDNSGLIVGDMNDTFKKIYISLDLEESMIEKIEPNSLVLTHHPLIFSPLKTINNKSYSEKLLVLLIRKNIKLISMHTNIDKTHLNKYVVSKILGLKIEYTDNFICYVKLNKSFDSLNKKIVKKLNLKFNKYLKCNNTVKTLAIATGSAMSLLSEIKADCFLTGDIKYHDAVEAKARHISLIDIGHYESEYYFATLMKNLIKKYLIKNEIKAIIVNSKNPFSYK